MRDLIIRLIVITASPAIGLYATVAEGADTFAEAKEATSAGQAALDAKEYAKAVDRFQRAIELWKQIEASGDAQPEASKLRKRCENNLRFAVEKPLSDRVQAARRLAREGDIEGASEAYRALVREYDRTLKKYDYGSLKQNRRFCVNYIGMVAIKKAEELRKKREYGEAARYYRMAVERYRQAEELIHSRSIKDNIAYAEDRMHRMMFADRLERHAEAPDFELPTVADSAPLQLSNLRGKPALVVFWAAWCPSCKNCLPILSKFQHVVGEDRVTVVGICVDRVQGWDRGSSEKAERLVRDTLIFPNVWSDLRTTQAWGKPKGVPTAYWLDADGRLVGPASFRNLTLESLLRDFERVDQSGPGTSELATEAAE